MGEDHTISVAGPAPTERGRARPAVALAGLSLVTLLSSLGLSVANVALPALQGAFGAPFARVQWVVLAYLLVVTTLVVVAGRLGDLVGRRRLLVGGVALFTASSIGAGIAPALPLLIAARAAQGAGAAVMMALGLAFVADVLPAGRIGTGMGLLGTTSAVGTALGPSLGGLLLAGVGWRAIFLLNVPLGVAALLLVRRHLPRDALSTRPEPRAFDVAGTLLLAVALGAYALAMTSGAPGAGTAVLLGVSLTGLVALGVVESRVAAPLIRADLLRDRGLRAGLATSALVSTVMMATLVVGPFHLARALGLGAALTGLAMSVGPGVVVLAGVPAGRLVDRLGATRLTLGGLCAMGAGAVSLAVVPAVAGVVGYLIAMVVVTLGYALVQTANNTAVMASAPAADRGVVAGMLNLSRNVGLVTGASLMGAVFAFGTGTGQVASAEPGAVARGTHLTFGAATILIVAAIVVVGRSRPRPATAERREPATR